MSQSTIGSRIAARRKALGLTQRELAEQLHITDRAVSRWEREAGTPDISLLPPLAYALGISVGELLTGQPDSSPEQPPPPPPAPTGIPRFFWRLYRLGGWSGLLLIVLGAYGSWLGLPEPLLWPLFFVGLAVFLLAGLVLYPLLFRCPGCGRLLSVLRPKSRETQYCPRCGKALFLDPGISTLGEFLRSRKGEGPPCG